MKRKHTYSAVDVERLDVAVILQALAVGCIVAIDVAKTKFVAALATATGEVLKLVKFDHPRQTAAFLGLLKALRGAELKPKVVMEPTGTYGDALRYQCHRLGVPVHMMPPKHTHDFAEVFDGVPSMHDAKAAAVLAKLQAIKPAPVWQPESEAQRDLRAWVDQRNPIALTLALYHGQLEAMLARHWPEFGTVMDVHVRRSWFALVKAFPGPRAVNAAREEAAKTLHNASRAQLGHERIEAILDAAKGTMGMPMTKGEEQKLRIIAEQIEDHTHRQDAVDAEIAAIVRQDEVLSRLATVVGPACAAAVGTLVGSPLDFPSAGAFEKAMGLNLKERSSGNKIGQLSITKRGSGQTRQLLYMAALRLLNSDPVVVAWYRGRKGFKAGVPLKAIVAVMRKVARALWHVARGETFDAKKLFDVRRLDLTSVTIRPRFKFKTAPQASVHTAPSEGGAAIA
jgi:transposase